MQIAYKILSYNNKKQKFKDKWKKDRFNKFKLK